MSVHPQLRDRAKRLRRDATVEERKLWALLSGLNRQKQAHFRRQAPIGPHIVDFADLSRRLVIEVDGGHHAASVADETRDRWLEAQGFRVLHFWNTDVTQMPEAVFDTVVEALALTTPHPLPPHKGEGGADPATAPASTPCATNATSAGQSASLPLVGRERVGGLLPSRP